MTRQQTDHADQKKRANKTRQQPHKTLSRTQIIQKKNTLLDYNYLDSIKHKLIKQTVNAIDLKTYDLNALSYFYDDLIFTLTYLQKEMKASRTQTELKEMYEESLHTPDSKTMTARPQTKDRKTRQQDLTVRQARRHGNLLKRRSEKKKTRQPSRSKNNRQFINRLTCTC